MKNIKKTIGERINIQLGKKDILQKDLAKHLGVSDNMVSYYISGTRTPNFDRLVEIAKFFDVSTDYLLGKTDADTNDKDIQYICDYMYLTKEALNKWMGLFDNVILWSENDNYDLNKYIERINSIIVDDDFFLILDEIIRIEDFCDYSIINLNDGFINMNRLIDEATDEESVETWLNELSLHSAELIMKGNVNIDALLYRIYQMTIKIAECKRKRYTDFVEYIQESVSKKHEEIRSKSNG